MRKTNVTAWVMALIFLGMGGLYSAPLPPAPSGNYILNSDIAQNARVNIGTATIRGTLTVGVFNPSAITASSITATSRFIGPGAGLTGVPLSALSAGTLPITIPASSITASGVVPGIYGGPIQAPQITIGSDGRITSATQYNVATDPAVYTHLTNLDSSTQTLTINLASEVSNRRAADLVIGLTTASLRTDLTTEASNRAIADAVFTANVATAAHTNSANTYTAQQTFQQNTYFPYGTWNTGGQAGVGTQSPYSKFHVVGLTGGDTGVPTGAIAAFATGTGGLTDESLMFGVVDGAYHWIQAAKSGTGNRKLILNPSGGNVGINDAAAANTFSVIGGTLDVNSLASAKSHATVYIQPKNSSAYGLALGSGHSGKPFIQNVTADGLSAGDLILQPFGGFVGIGESTPTIPVVIHYPTGDTQLEIGYADTYAWRIGRIATGGIAGSLQFVGLNGGAVTSGPIFDLNGNVGIKTPTPQYPLDINGGMRSYGARNYFTSLDAYALAVGTATGKVSGYIGGSADNASDVVINNPGGSEIVRFTNARTVGIGGVTTPAYTLDIAGDLRTTGNMAINPGFGILASNVEAGNYGGRGTNYNIGSYDHDLSIQYGGVGFSSGVVIGAQSSVNGYKLTVSASANADIALVSTNTLGDTGAIASIAAYGYDGVTGPSLSSRIVFRTNGTWSNTNHGTDVVFSGTSNGSVAAAAEWMRLRDAKMGVGTTTPRATIDIVGGLGLYPRTKAQLLAITPTEGEEYYCSDCSPKKVVVSTGTAAGNFADATGGTFK